MIKRKALLAFDDFTRSEVHQAERAVWNGPVECQALFLTIRFIRNALEVVARDLARMDCFEKRLHDEVIANNHFRVGKVESNAGRNAVHHDAVNRLFFGGVHIHIDGKVVDFCEKIVFPVEFNEQSAVLTGHQFGGIQSIVRHLLFTVLYAD